MSTRSSFVIVGSAVGCSVLLFCLCVFVLAGYSYLSGRPARTVDRIAYVDNDQNIQSIDARGERRVALTTDASSERIYAFPTWSPDSQHIAFVSVSGQPGQREGVLHSAPIGGGDQVTVFKSTSQFPFYLYWSPDSRQIGFLAQGTNEMALMLGDADGKKDARKLETGSPFYWAWAPDSRALLVHIGGSRRESRQARLALLRWQDSNTAQVLTRGPGTFESPHYSPDGSSILYAAANESGVEALYLADAHDANARSIVNYQGRIAFAWSPNGKKIATMITPEDALLPYLAPLFVSEGDGRDRRAVTNEDALAFYWSPDSHHVAYLTIVAPGDLEGCATDCGRMPGAAAPLRQGERTRLRWRTVNVEDGRTRTIATFSPTEDLVSLLPYFDQYARSLTFWSPDSTRLVYTHNEGNGRGSVWVASVDGTDPPRRIGDGTVAVWSWK